MLERASSAIIVEETESADIIVEEAKSSSTEQRCTHSFEMIYDHIYCRCVFDKCTYTSTYLQCSEGIGSEQNVCSKRATLSDFPEDQTTKPNTSLVTVTTFLEYSHNPPNMIVQRKQAITSDIIASKQPSK